LHDIEVIVIDDGSPDDSAGIALAAAAGDTRLRVIRLARNGGVSAARNAGIDAARGTWLAILDADDAFVPERLERLVAAAEAGSADLLADNLIVHRSETEEPETLAFPAQRMADPGPVDAFALVRTDRAGWGTRAAGFIKPLMRRAFLAAHGLYYPTDLAVGEDFHLYLRALLHGARLLYVPGAYYRYAIADHSLSRADDDKIQASFDASSRLLIAEAHAQGRADLARALERRRREFAAHGAYKALSTALRERRFKGAWNVFFRTPAPAGVLQRVVASARRRAGFPIPEI